MGLAAHNSKCPNLPSKHARSDSHQIQIGSEALARSGPDDSYTTAQNLTQSARTKSGLVLHNNYDVGLLWKNVTESGSGKLVAGQLPSRRTGLNDSCIYGLASRPDLFGQNLTRPSSQDPGWFCTI